MHLHRQLWIDFIHLCRGLSDDQYTHQCKALNGATIGEHLRHSYEFYECLLEGVPKKTVSYEARQRDSRLQNERDFSLEKMENLITRLEKLTTKGTLRIISKEADQNSVKSSIERELIYCLDHAIHHQALIKIGLNEIGCNGLVTNEFGVAYSTLRYRKQSV